MLADDFDFKTELARTECHRCYSVGLKQIDWDTYCVAPDRDRLKGRLVMCPGVFCLCPSCGFVAQLHELRTDDPD